MQFLGQAFVTFPLPVSSWAKPWLCCWAPGESDQPSWALHFTLEAGHSVLRGGRAQSRNQGTEPSLHQAPTSVPACNL